MISYLALGDSYTIGEGLPLEDSWPHQLVRLLSRKHVEIGEPDIIARTGWTSSELLSAIDEAHARLTPPYDFVTLLIGVNNQYRGESLDDYSRDFDELLKRAIAFAGGRPERVFVLSIPDWSATPYARDSGRDPVQIRTELNGFNRVNARAAYREKVSYLNITEISRLAGREPSLLNEDGLHYSARLYRRWLEELVPKVWQGLYPGRDINIPILYKHGHAPEDQPA